MDCSGGVRLRWWWNWQYVFMVWWKTKSSVKMDRQIWSAPWRRIEANVLELAYSSSEKCITSLWANVLEHSFWNLHLVKFGYRADNGAFFIFLFFFQADCLDFPFIFQWFSFHSLLLQNYLIPSSLNYKLADLVFNFSADMTFKSNTPRSEFGSPKMEKTKRILANHMHLYSGRVNQTSPCKIRGMCVAFSSAEDISGQICKHPINLICFCI